MLHRNCVPRSLYDQKCAEYTALLDKYHALKQTGAVLPPEPKAGRVVPPGPSPEAIAAKKMHDQVVEEIAADLERMPGIDPALARAEAKRLREAAFGVDGVP